MAAALEHPNATRDALLALLSNHPISSAYSHNQAVGTSACREETFANVKIDTDGEIATVYTCKSTQ